MSHLLPFVLRFYIKGLLALKYIMLNCDVDVIQVKRCITSLTVEIIFFFFLRGNKGEVCLI